MLIIALNIFDSFLSSLLLNDGGMEINPIMYYAISHWGAHAWGIKFAVVFLGMIFLCFHSHFRLVNKAILGIAGIYTAVVSCQIAMIILS
jgi:hypothetical protein